MDVKRGHERTASDLKSTLIVDHRQVSGRLANLSAGRAFIPIGQDDYGKIASQDMGQFVVLRLEAGHSSVNQKGHICRSKEDQGDKYVAVPFVGTPKAFI